jgi:CheY-like chemotaxis protein
MRKYKIIVVENDEDEQFFLKEGFDASGLFEIVAQAKNGDALFEWLEENPSNLPDLILSDLNMPGKNGYDIISGIKASPVYSHIPVVITSTSNIRSIMDKCLQMGAAEYVVKPDSFIEYASYAERFHRLIKENELVK